MTSAFPLPHFEYPSEVEEVIRACWIALGSWRSFLVAVDGRDGVGKTAFARFLSYRCNMPVFEGDEFLVKGQSFKHRKELGRVIGHRLENNRPAVLDSIFASDACAELGLVPDYIIRVARVGVLGMDRFRDRYEDYEGRVAPNSVLVLPCRSIRRPLGCGMAGSTGQTECADCPDIRWLEASSFPWKLA